MREPVTYSRTVRFSDTDCQGHVFNANYLVYVDDALTDYLSAIGFPYAEISRRGYDLVLARAECDFRSTAVLGEVLDTEIRAERVGNSSIVFGFKIVLRGGERLVAEGKEVYVVLDGERRPTRVPEFLRAAIEALQGEG